MVRVNSHLKVHGYDEYLEGKITSNFLYERRRRLKNKSNSLPV